MLTNQWQRWMRRNASKRRAAPAQLRVESLEGRDVPSTVMYGGNVSSTSQFYNHPNAAGTALSGQAVAFQAMAFHVSIDDTYTLTNSSNTFSAPGAGDGFFALYQTSFNPANPLNNLVAVSDNGAGLGLRPQITQELAPGTAYFLVTSPASGGSVGDFIDQISSPGNGTYSFSTHSMPAVDSPILTNVSGTAATLGGVVEGDGGAAVTERGIVYSVNSANGAPTIGGAGVTKVAIGSGTGSFMTSVTGLALGTTYAFRAYATNAVGTFYTSPVTTFVANTPPMLGGMIATAQSVSDMATIQPFVLATVTDPDSPPQTETATITYTGANGTFTGLGGFTGSAGSYTMTGSVAAVQAAIRGLTFVPTAHQVSAGKTVTTNFTVSVSDGFAIATDSETNVVATAASTGSAVTVGGVTINDGSAQRSEVDSLTVTFSGPVTFANNNPLAAFQLLHLRDGQLVDLAANASTNAQGQTVVTLTFSGPETDPVSTLNDGPASLSDGRYQLTILSSDVTGTGNGLALNGGGPNGNYVSPADTLGGGAGKLHLYRLFGDVDGNGIVDQLDLGTFRTTFNSAVGNPSYLWYLDADGGGAVDQTSLGQLRARFNLNVF
jgi:hypothetical protein